MARSDTKTSTLNDLLHHQLDTLYGIETEGKATLTSMAEAASSPAVRKELEAAVHETTTHLKRLDDVFATIGQKPRAKTGHAASGLFQDCVATAKIDAAPDVRDAAMIAMAQAVQHNEIVGYGTAHAWAETLKQDKIGQLLRQTLDEERASSKRLTDLAKPVNTAAAERSLV